MIIKRRCCLNTCPANIKNKKIFSESLNGYLRVNEMADSLYLFGSKCPTAVTICDDAGDNCRIYKGLD